MFFFLFFRLWKDGNTFTEDFENTEKVTCFTVYYDYSLSRIFWFSVGVSISNVSRMNKQKVEGYSRCEKHSEPSINIGRSWGTVTVGFLSSYRCLPTTTATSSID